MRTAPARSTMPHSSAQDRATGRRPAARSTGSAPAPAPGSARSGRPRRSPRCPLRGQRAGRGVLAVIVLPVALLLQGVSDVLRHIGLIVLGKHGIGNKGASLAELAFG